MHLEHNLNMLMTKMGVTPSNTLPSDAPEQLPIANVNKTMKERVEKSNVVQDLDGDFRMTEEEFDNMLEDCPRAQGDIHTDNTYKVPSPPETVQDGDPDL